MSGSPNKTKAVVAAALFFCVAVFYLGYGSHSQWVDFGFRMLNFVLFIAIIGYAAGGRISRFLCDRSEGITAELTELEKARDQAFKQLKEVEAKIINLDKERQVIMAAYKAQGEALRSEIIVKAEKNARQIIAQAKLTAQGEADKIAHEMRAEMAEKIFTAAEGLLRKQLDTRGHAKLIDKSLSRVVLN